MKARLFAIRVGVAATVCVAATTALAQYGAQPFVSGHQPTVEPVYETAALPSYRQPAVNYQPPQYRTTATQAPAVQYQPQPAYQTAPQYQQTQPYQAAPQYQQPTAYPQAGVPQQGYTAQGYAPAQPAARVAMQQNDLPIPPTPGTGQPTPAVGAPPTAYPTMPAGPTGAETVNPGQATATEAAPTITGSYSETNYGYGGSDCGCEEGGCNDCGIDCCVRPLCRQWFVGVYSIGLARDNPGRYKLGALVDSPASYPYYPTAADTVIETGDLDQPWQWGGEVRIGSTFGRACDPCNPCATYRPFAWEAGYWGIVDDTESTVVTDVWSDTDRMYGMVNFAGLEYDRDGAGGGTWAYRPVNDYYDYQMPIEDPTTDPNDVRVLGFRARQNFQAQNIEVNFFRFGNQCGCDPCCPPRLTFNGLLGMRYLKLDEQFQWATMFTTVDGGGNPNAGEPTAYTSFPTNDDNNLFYDIDTENHLIGFQFGGNVNYAIGCRLSLFCDSNLGIYNNHIQADHRVWSGGGGDVRFINGGGAAVVSNDKNDVAFIGECRLGGAYQITCNSRLTLAYRVIGVSGVALATEQIATDYSNAAHVGYIDSNDSIILHGVQMGAEFKF